MNTQTDTNTDKKWPPFEVVDHTADWAIRVNGRDLPQLFRHAAEGMLSLVVAEGTAVPSQEERQLYLEAFDVETLLVDWLSELAYWLEEEQFAPCAFTLEKVTPTSLSATLQGGRVAELLKHIKAVTYHDLAVRSTAFGLSATIVFDV